MSNTENKQIQDTLMHLENLVTHLMHQVGSLTVENTRLREDVGLLTSNIYAVNEDVGLLTSNIYAVNDALKAFETEHQALEIKVNFIEDSFSGDINKIYDII